MKLSKVFHRQFLWLVVFLVFPGISFAAKAKLAKPCTLISGTIVQKPHKSVFKFNSSRQFANNGYPMSHTQFYIDSGRVVYKVVVDNLFYTNLTDIQANSHDDVGIIDDFTRRYPVGSSVEACGKVSKSGGNFALHFVHPSACDKVKFNGFLHINGQDVTANQRYCGNCGCKVSYN